MKQIKTAYEILKESGVYPEDFISFSTMGGCENAMRAYAEQFIEAAAEEAKITNPYQDARWLGLKKFEDIESYIHSHPPKINKQSILKLKEHLK